MLPSTVSLRLRLSLAFLIVATLVVGGFGWLQNQRLARFLEAELAADRAGIRSRLSTALAQPAWTVDLPACRALITGELEGCRHLAWVELVLDVAEPLRFGRRNGTIVEIPTTGPADDIDQVLLGHPDDPGVTIATVSIGIDRSLIDGQLNHSFWTLIATVGILDVILALLANLVVHRLLLRRLDRLDAVLATAPGQETGGGDPVERIVTGTHDLLARLTDLVEAISDAIVTTDTELRIERTNPAVAELGIARPAKGTPLAAALAVVDEQGTSLADAVREEVLGQGHKLEVARHWRLGARHLGVSAGPIRRHDGRLAGAVLVLRDLTEVMALENRLREHQKLESIGHLAGGVAHDLNNMLGAIIGATELAQGQIHDPSRLHRSLTLILNSASQAADFTRKLLAFARTRPEQRIAVDLNDLLDQAATLLRHTVDRRIEITVAIDPRAGRVIGDHSELLATVMNLGINARDAMPGGGRLELRSRRRDQATSEIAVTDEGCGIPTEIRDRIFEPFFTTKPVGAGTGLGLAAVYGTVRAHGGTVEVESSEGRGTTFRLALPIDRSCPAAPPTSTRNDPEAWQTSGRILLAEDEPLVREITASILTGVGFEVIESEDGHQALERFRAAPGSFDLVILDLIMPRLGGADCFRALRDLDPDVRVLFVSGYSADNEPSRLLNEGGLGYVQKPFRGGILLEAVREALERHR